MKLGHDDCERLLRDVIEDFPVEVLLQRIGLLQGVLDIVGALPRFQSGAFSFIFYQLFHSPLREEQTIPS